MNVAETSIHAYMNEVAPTLGARQITVAEVFERAPDRDFSNSEIGQALGWSVNRVTGRTNELRGMGILVFSQRRTCGVTTRPVKAWKLSIAAPVSVKALGQTPTFVQFPSRSDRGRRQTVKLNGSSAVCTCRGFYYRGKCSHVSQALKQTPEPKDEMTPLFV